MVEGLFEEIRGLISSVVLSEQKSQVKEETHICSLYLILSISSLARPCELMITTAKITLTCESSVSR
jgi:hypothetical protein